MRSRPILGVVLLVGASSFVSCKSLSSGAREDFAKRHSCPEDRLEVKGRKDVDWSAVVFRDVPLPRPPKEVTDDPARLAKWRADRKQDDENRGRAFSDYDVFEVRGCDKHEILGCAHPTGHDGRTKYISSVVCQAHPIEVLEQLQRR